MRALSKILHALAVLVMFAGSSAAAAAQSLTWYLTSPSVAPSPRCSPVVFDSARNQIVLFGGYDGQRRNDTWIWDGTDWTRIDSPTAPTPRFKHSMVFDSNRGVVVLFGGADASGDRSDTWEFDGSAWTERAPGTNPPARDWSALAFDSSRGRTVLFGGFQFQGGTSTNLSDTWEWDGNDWIEMSPAAAPSARNGHAMIYDPARGQIMLFGGYSGSRLADTWSWDGGQWTQLSPANSPSARNLHTLAYDAGSDRVVLFGGLGEGDTYLSDTWEWDGADWAAVSVGVAPRARCDHGATYDAARGQMFIFGGSGGSASLAQLGGTFTLVPEGSLPPQTQEEAQALEPSSSLNGTPNPTPTRTNTPTQTPTPSPGVTGSPSATPSATPTFTRTPTRTPTSQGTPAGTGTPTVSPTPSVTTAASETESPTGTPTSVPSPSASPQATPSSTATPASPPIESTQATATVTPTAAATGSAAATAVPSASISPTIPAGGTEGATPTPLATSSASSTPAGTETPGGPAPDPTPPPGATVRGEPTGKPPATPTVVDGAPTNGATVALSGRVSSGGSGVRGAFVSASLAGSTLTDELGQFRLDLPRAESFAFSASRTGFSMLPSAASVAAESDQYLEIEAIPDGVDRTGCRAKDLAANKVAFSAALLEILSIEESDISVKSLVVELLKQNARRPEVVYSCSAKSSCSKVSLAPIARKLSAGLAKLEAKTVGRRKARARRGDPGASVIKRKLKVLRSQVKRGPGNTFLCL